MYLHAYTLYSSVRPFGCSVMIGSYDSKGPQLYVIDPSGLCHVSLMIDFFINKFCTITYIS